MRQENYTAEVLECEMGAMRFSDKHKWTRIATSKSTEKFQKTAADLASLHDDGSYASNTSSRL